MAKHRFGKKKGKRVNRKGTRKNSRRVAAGRKAWRSRVKRFGSKKAALAATFGNRFGGKKGKRKGKKGKKGHHRGGGGGRKVSNANYKLMLAQIQDANKTTGWPPTPSEEQAAYEAARLYHIPFNGKFTGGRHRDSEEALRERLRERLRKEQRAAAAELIAIQHRERAARRKREEQEDAEREVAREMKNLST